jgi:hypothetical protein
MKEPPQVNTDSPRDKNERLTYLNISLSKKGIAECSGKTCMVFIPREEILRIESRIGSRAERPLGQGILGILLSGLGVYGLCLISEVGWVLLRWEGGFVVFGGIGVWLLYEVARRGHHLLVTGPKETRKLMFHGKVEEAKLREFLTNAAGFGYDCRTGA